MDDSAYWTMVGALGQIAGAAATFAAVVVSLWIALSARRPRLQLSVGIWTFFGDVADDEVIGFTVINGGQQPVRIVSYGWRSGVLRKRHAMINHAQVHPYQPELPCTLQPGDKVMFLNDPEVFRGEVRRIPDFFAWRLLARWHPSRLEGAVHLAVGVSKYARVSKHVRAMVLEELPQTDGGRSD